MDPRRWQVLSDLFHAALERSALERDAFLDEACGDDAALRAEAGRLLSAHERADAFMRTSAGAEAVMAIDDEGSRVGHELGPYRIVREIGRGGMGAVYLAERVDQQFEQRVAIKLIKRGMDTDSVLRHFRDERQILATLDHPNIARLLDGGASDDGLPYLVMEYIDGTPIDEFCAAHGLSIARRLELFQAICAAVAYAHRRLVVHCDIKPSNVLVTAEGVPKLLDFGVARIMHGDGGGGTLPTRADARLMTPEYASPEHFEDQRVTTLSDVYSLGVMLYEILSGRSPYDFSSRSPREIANVIATSEPRKPSDAATDDRWRRALRGDLDNIVLMAIRKEPDRRYESVERFSDDIRRHLRALPVAARKDTIAYRAAKFVRRNRKAVAAAALVALTLVGGIVATTWQARRARIQESLAKAEQARAEHRFDEVRKLARSVLFDYHDAIKDLPGATPVRERLVKDAREYLDSLSREANDPSLLNELATAYERVGDVQGGTMFANLGDTAGAIESYGRALALRQTAIGPAPDYAARAAFAGTHRKLALLLWETGDTTGALEKVRQALSLFAAIAADRPDDHGIRFELAVTYDYLAMVLQERGDPAASLENLRSARESYAALPAAMQTEARVRRGMSVALEHEGSVHLSMGELDKALAATSRAIDLRSALSTEFPLNSDYRRALAVSYYNQGEILARLGRTQEATVSYRRDLAIVEALSLADPRNEQYRGDVAYGLIRIGDMLMLSHDAAGALTQYRRSLTMRNADVKADPANLWKRASLIEAHAKIAKALAERGERDEAVWASARTVGMIDETAVEATNVQIRTFFADTFSDLAQAHQTIAGASSTAAGARRERWTTARALYERSLDIWIDLRTRGLLSAIDREKPDRMAEAVAACDRILETR